MKIIETKQQEDGSSILDVEFESQEERELLIQEGCSRIELDAKGEELLALQPGKKVTDRLAGLGLVTILEKQMRKGL